MNNTISTTAPPAVSPAHGHAHERMSGLGKSTTVTAESWKDRGEKDNRSRRRASCAVAVEVTEGAGAEMGGGKRPWLVLCRA